MNYAVTLQYDGTRYHGWQRQGNTPGTIQGKVEEILSRLTGQAVELHGAGRTDAGVHALAQVASFRLAQELPPAELLSGLNRHLPADIAAQSLDYAPERFHARLHATGKLYRYSLRLGAIPDVFRRQYQVRVEEPLDLAAMKVAAKLLTGRQDYRSFCGNRRFQKSTLRTVWEIDFQRQGQDLDVSFHGTGFLPYMVRILMGTLLEVGRNQRPAETMPAVLAARDRSAAGKTAPAQGLTLVQVEYRDMEPLSAPAK